MQGFEDWKEPMINVCIQTYLWLVSSSLGMSYACIATVVAWRKASRGSGVYCMA